MKRQGIERNTEYDRIREAKVPKLMVRRKEELKNSVGPKFGYEHLIAKTAMIGENRQNVLDHRYRKHRKSQLYPGTKKTNSSLQDDDDDMETDEDGFIPPKQLSPSSNGFIS